MASCIGWLAKVLTVDAASPISIWTIDEHQVAKAIQLGAEKAEKIGFQYIVTMNSDAVLKESFDRQFDVNNYILPIKLTDAFNTGGSFRPLF